MRRISVAMAVAGILIASLTPASGSPAVQEAPQIDKTDNARHLFNRGYTGGTELAGRRHFMYSAEFNGDDNRNQDPEKGGIHIYDVETTVPREVGFLPCPGNDNDVEVVKPGLIAVGFHTNNCAPAESGEVAHGFLLADVRDPAKPKVVSEVNLPTGGSSHTIRVYPGGKYLYVNPGGLPTNGGANEHIYDISDRRNPKLVKVFGRAEGGPPNGCHDLSFRFTEENKLAFCAGKGSVDIWDVSDPVNPVPIGEITNPEIEFDHYAVASSDGKLLAVDDEAFAYHECRTGTSPTGAVWVYDISDPTAPVFQSRFSPPRGGDETGIGTYEGWIPSWCLAHGLDWKPGTHKLAVTWFTGGWSVLDYKDPAAPEEVAYFMAENSATYSVLWHRRRLFTNDTYRGFDAFKVKF